MFLPYSSPNMWTTQAMVALWQPCPLYVDILIWVFSKFSSSATTMSPPHQQGIKRSSRDADIPYLTRIYISSCLVTAVSHLTILYLTLFSSNPSYSFKRMFLHPTSHSSTSMSLVQGIHAIFQADFWIIFAGSLIWAFLGVWDLKRVGNTEVSLWAAGGMMVVGAVLVGPGAVVAGVWCWREGRLAGAEGEGEKKGR